MERIIKLKLLNNHITCKICRGYLVDATTVTECLHTFCKCCLVKHLEDNNTCPTCKIIIHQSHPLQYISYDRTMQDIVFKLVPNLEQNELKREREFYQKRNLPNPKDVNNTSITATNSDNVVSNSPATVVGNNTTSAHLHQQSAHSLTSQTNDYHRKDEQVNVCLDTANMGSLKALQRRFLRLSAQATIMHLKKFVAKKVLNDMDKCHDIDIYCNNELLGKDHTLKFVDPAIKQFLIVLDETLKLGRRFIVQDLDETHLFVSSDIVETLQTKLDDILDQINFTVVEKS